MSPNALTRYIQLLNARVNYLTACLADAEDKGDTHRENYLAGAIAEIKSIIADLT
jgi:hypothetical protein